jgi:anti-sigma regulatory factor (Ser/Thr protein kinase)
VKKIAAGLSKNARRARADQAVTIAVSIEDEVICACVGDQGSGLACGTTHTCPSPRQTHGRGLYLTRSLMDGVEIDCSSGTTVSMQRRLARRQVAWPSSTLSLSKRALADATPRLPD